MGNQLRICMLAFQFAPVVGGAETRAEKQARRLQELGHEVMIITLRHERPWPKQEDYEGLPVTRIGGIYRGDGMLRVGRLGHLPIDVLAFKALWEKRHQYDLIHSLQISTISAAALLVGKLTKKPVVISLPSTGPGKRQRPEDAVMMVDTLAEKQIDTSFLQVPFDDIMVGGLDHLKQTAVGGRTILNAIKKSDAHFQILSKRSKGYLTANGFRSERIFWIPNGIDTEKFRPDPSRRPDPAQPERNILCVARLEFPKGVDVLLHAWKRMLNAPAQWRLHLKPRLRIAGNGALQDQIERLARELEIEESVEFLGLRKDVIPLLQQSWGFILPSRWEGMPNALLEAMACGAPSIATRVSGSEDIIEHGVNGLMVEPEEPAEMAVALQQLIGDTPLAQRLAEAGRATILQDYQLSHITDKCLELYRYALKKASATSLADTPQNVSIHHGE